MKKENIVGIEILLPRTDTKLLKALATSSERLTEAV
jgi:hypothetical protein